MNRKSKTEKTDTISKNADSKSFDDLPYFDNYEKPPPIPNFRESQSTENFTQHKSLNNDVNVIIKNAHYGLTKKDRILIPPIFNQYEYYTKEKYLNDKIILKFDDFYGIYDFNKEKWIIPLRYFSLKILDENKILANKDRKIGIIDFNNNILHEFEWAEFITHVNYPYISTANNTFIYLVCLI
ncbi:MAG: hypothetical protein IPL95_08710 [Saprospiraceae bacterium]|nr:hypothetical protein [Saprospiraceae bacterium]